MGPGEGRVGKEAGHQANTLGDNMLESMQASKDKKVKGRLSAGSCGTSGDIIPRTQGSQFLPLGFLVIVLTGFRHVFQEVRNSILQRKGDCHFYVLTGIIPNSSGCGKGKGRWLWE